MTQEFKKPMLAGSADLLSLQYPIAVTPKFDGIRVVVLDGQAVSRTLKPIRNKGVQEVLSGLPSIIDGEVMSSSNNFQDSTTAVMSEGSDIPWKFHMFDYIPPGASLEMPYIERMRALKELTELRSFPEHCEIVYPDFIYEIASLRDIAEEHLLQGYEGTMIRDPQGKYKCGRSTTREGLLLKLKQFVDTEARIVGFEELMHNDNQAVVNSLGLTERSSHKENKRSSGMLGAFIVQSLENPDLTYKVGTGLTRTQRIDFWNRQDELLGQLVKVKYFNQGIKSSTGCPRHPVWLGMRHPDDM